MTIVILKLVIACAILASTALAFTAVTSKCNNNNNNKNKNQRQQSLVLYAEQKHYQNKHHNQVSRRFFAFLATSSLMSINTVPASAVDVDATSVSSFTSSSVHLADAIKVLDMSMPTYDDVKSSKASVANVKSLSVDPKSATGSGTAGVASGSGSKKKGMSSYSSSIGSSSSKKEKKEKVGEYIAL